MEHFTGIIPQMDASRNAERNDGFSGCRTCKNKEIPSRFKRIWIIWKKILAKMTLIPYNGQYAGMTPEAEKK
ncbi:MAG: hypothetical protein MSD70_01270 [Clostridiales bacterium]|nr:hypothetical protein [Clostridiales bacterium]MDY3763290.1 hypothetical protein [Candidatus Ventricola sp.]MDY3832492.1 hypothetical protein [Candidatus Ventricola sp.]